MGRGEWLYRAFLLLTAFCIGNAVLYSLAAATPLIQADGWYFLESFLPKYFDGTLSFADLFMKRGATDHSQPLQKLVLLFHTHFFNMDFRVEGLIGALFGVAWCYVVSSEISIFKSASVGNQALRGLAIVLVFAIGLSLNSTNVFTWPLVTLGYMTLFISTLYFKLLMRAWNRPCALMVFLASLFLGLAIDTQAIVVLIAMALALLPMSPINWRSAGRQVTAAIAALLLARLVLWALTSANSIANTEEASRSIFSLLTEPGTLKGLLIPFSDSLVHIEHLARRFPESYAQLSTFTGLAAITLHVWFWARAFLAWRNFHYYRTTAMAVFLMLMAYGLTAAIVIGRVPLFDWNYLHQPRYVLTYEISLVAIATMIAETLLRSSFRPLARIAEPALLLVLVLTLLIVQMAVSREAWKVPYYLTGYWQNTALDMQRVANAPLADPGKCSDIMSVCEYSPERRERLMGMLSERQLNVFSPAFQMRNRIYPNMDSIPGFAADNAAQIQLETALRAAPLPVLLSIDHQMGCANDDSLVETVIDIRLQGLAARGAQLWLEAVGAQRQLLHTVDPKQSQMTISRSLPNNSHLTLVANGTNTVLDQAELALGACPAR